jgi:hypothetical protein
MKNNALRLLAPAVVLLFMAASTGAGDGEAVGQSDAVDPATGEEINWQVISSGGTDGISTNYKLAGTVGQTAVGTAGSDNFGLSHGFWQEFGTASCCGIYTGGYTGNTNCDTEGKRNLADVTQLISRVYLTPEVPLCCEENGNTNGDPAGTLNLADITKLIDHVYISHAETAPCP